MKVSIRNGAGGTPIEKWDHQGAIFAPAPGASYPVFAYGHGKTKDPVFTCPVSAIPDHVWTLIDLWLTCRSMKALPLAGGVLDQPLIVRRSWPVLEDEFAPFEEARSKHGQAELMAGMIGSLFGRKIGRR